jgi:predicted transcriptional regulator
METKNMQHIPKPTAAELNILRVLWQLGPSTVRSVHEVLSAVEPSGYTTALKMLQVMHQKGLVVRDDSQRAHVYSAAASKLHTQREFLDDLVSKLFDGSTSEMVLEALGNAPKADSKEMDKIRDLIRELENK